MNMSIFFSCKDKVPFWLSFIPHPNVMFVSSFDLSKLHAFFLDCEYFPMIELLLIERKLKSKTKILIPLTRF